jgi:hypothetical protein
MEVFIVRPFGSKRPVLKKNKEGTIETVLYNFDAVEQDLIQPALQQLGFKGGTTGEVFEAGDIREDMFSALLMADFVVADITIHNANVFYELGIRHALRDKRTVLIKASGFDETPFDIIGYKYLSYDEKNPATALPAFIRALEETASTNRIDSPVFNILPNLKTQDTEDYFALPHDFIEETAIAASTKNTGKLALLSNEADFFSWGIAAWRFAGKALFRNKAWLQAKEVWEKVKAKKPGDVQVHEHLATIYQRLAEAELPINEEEAMTLLARSDLAIDIIIKNNSNSYELAEAYALRARNAKTRWLQQWNRFTGVEAGTKALESIHLSHAMKYYEKGFAENLNHYYSGINALGLLISTLSLAQQYPHVWEAPFATDEEAKQEIKKLQEKEKKLAVAVELSIDAAKQKAESTGGTDTWALITEADYIFLTSTKPARVATAYAKQLQTADNLTKESVVRQIKIYEQLGVKTENVTAAMQAINLHHQAVTTIHYLLFTGHMIDKTDRAAPRFPAAKEVAAKEQIKQKIKDAVANAGAAKKIIGIAGGACGADILFHETCKELNIESKILLAIPPDDFIASSVSFAGAGWVQRFHNLLQQIPHPVLMDKPALPSWLTKNKDYTIWIRNNLWLLNTAQQNGTMNMTLIALWDGKGGDGPGGTKHMVETAKAGGAKTFVIDINAV